MRSPWVLQSWVISTLVLVVVLRFVVQPHVAGRLLRLRVEDLEREFAEHVPPGRRARYKVAGLLAELKTRPARTARQILDAPPAADPGLPDALGDDFHPRLLGAVEEYLCDLALFPHERARIRVALGTARSRAGTIDSHDGTIDLHDGTIDLHDEATTPLA